MNGVFGVGPFEMLLIAVLALIFIGPQKLPATIAQVMRTIRELRSYAMNVQQEFHEELQGLRDELEGVRQEMEQLAQDVDRDISEMASEVQQVTEQAAAATEPVNELLAPPPPRDGTAPLPSLNGVHANGASRDADEDLPTFADYRPS